MKKLCLLLLLCFLSVTTALADSPRFDNMRTVVIADTTQDSYAARFMKSRLKQPSASPTGTASKRIPPCRRPTSISIRCAPWRLSIKPTSSWSRSSRPGTGGSTWPDSGAMMTTKSSRNVSIT